MSERKAKEKRSKNPDNLFQRGDVWWIRYNVGGMKQRYSLETKSQREAKRLRDQILAKRSVAARFGLEAPVPKKERTFGQVLDLWLEWRKSDPDLAPATLRNSDHRARLWLRPFFGQMFMSEITREHIEQFIAHLRKAHCKGKGKGKDGKRKGLSEGTVTNIFDHLKLVFHHAIKRDWYTGPNPIDKLDRQPRRAKPRDVTLTEDEAKRLLGKLTGELHFKVALALATGLRWGEVHGLAWLDIDLDSSPPTLTVRRSYQGKPKNEASAATIPLNGDAVASLRRWRSLQGVARYVFPNGRGGLRAQVRWWDRVLIKRAAEQAGIDKHITPHVFRHTFGTWVYEHTRDVKGLQRLMRHASFTTSMRYVHDRRELGEVVNRLPRLTAVELKAA